MKKDFKKLLIVPLLIIAVGPFYTSPAAAGTVSDNFTGATVNKRLWQPFEESQSVRLSQQGGELRIQIDGGSVDHGAGINSKFRLKGDFDAIVDYRLISWPPANGVRLGFEGGPNDQGFMVKRVSFGPDELPNQGEAYFAFFSDASQWYGNQVTTTDTQGSLRLTRVGSVFTGYFKQKEGDWTKIADHTFSAPELLEWVDFALWAIGDPPAGQDVEIAFSNFQVTYDQIKYLSAAAAGTMLLLD
jgi:hypothetical protein